MRYTKERISQVVFEEEDLEFLKALVKSFGRTIMKERIENGITPNEKEDKKIEKQYFGLPKELKLVVELKK